MATIVRDSMTGTGYADLDDPSEHSTEVGGPWVRNAATPSTRWYLMNNRVHCGEAGAVYASGTPANADYYVEADYIIYSDIAGAGICLRMSVSDLTFYYARYTNGQMVLGKYVAGVETWIGTWAASLTGQHKLRLTATGTTIKVTVDGVDRITVTDSSITAVGKAGMSSAGGNDVGTGKHIDNFVAVDGAVGSSARATVFAFIE